MQAVTCHILVRFAFNYVTASPRLTNPPKQPTVSCPEPSRKRPKSLGDEDETMLCKRVVTKDRRYITQITCYEKGANGKATGKPISRTPMRMPLFGKQGGGVLSSLFSKIGRQGEVSTFGIETQFSGNFKQ